MTLRYGFLTVILSLFISSASLARPVPDSFADLVDSSMPAVVNISTSQTISLSESNPLTEMFPNDEMPEDFPFRGLPELLEKFYGQQGGGEQKASSLGSGFIIDKDGYIVTNFHVIEQADEITVTFSDDTKAKAKVIGRDSKTDIALLKVDSKKPLPFVKWGNSDALRVGDWVVAIGNPFGLGGSVSAGILSARARDINAGPFDDFLQTDAAINRGNSGGPLFNMQGEVVGINSAIFSPSGGNVGVGFAVPSSLAWPVIQQLKEFGHTKRGWLGVKIQNVTDEIAESISLDKARGALVAEVTPDSPADKGGILPGDVILGFDGKDISVMRKLPRIVADTDIDKKVVVELWRKGKKKSVTITVAKLEEESAEKHADKKDDKKDNGKHPKENAILGLHLSPVDKTLQKRYDIEKEVTGLVIDKVESKSEAANKGLRRGDVITSLNQDKITSLEQFKTLLEQAEKAKRKSVLLLINRQGNTQFITLPLGKD